MHTSDAPYPSNGVGFSWLAINFFMACQDFYDESASFKKNPIPRDCILKLFDVRDYVSNDTSKMIQKIKIISYSIAKQQFFSFFNSCNDFSKVHFSLGEN